MGLELEAKGDMVEEQLMCRPRKIKKTHVASSIYFELFGIFPGP